MPRLIVEAGPQIGSEFDVGKRLLLGRMDTCDVQVLDDNVSREHASIRLVEGRFYVLDLDSRNGTFVNERRVKQAPLAPGDRIRVGDTVLLFFDEEHALRPTDTLGDEELKRITAESDAVEAAGDGASGETPGPKPAAPAAASPRAQVTAEKPARATLLGQEDAAAETPDEAARRKAAEVGLFLLVLLLTFLCVSYATQIALRLAAKS